MCIVSQSSSVVTGFLAGPVMVVSHASSVVTGFLAGPVKVVSQASSASIVLCVLCSADIRLK